MLFLSLWCFRFDTFPPSRVLAVCIYQNISYIQSSLNHSYTLLIKNYKLRFAITQNINFNFASKRSDTYDIGVIFPQGKAWIFSVKANMSDIFFFPFGYCMFHFWCFASHVLPKNDPQKMTKKVNISMKTFIKVKCLGPK